MAVGPALAVIGRLIQPSLKAFGSFVGVEPSPPKEGNRPAGAGLVVPIPAPPDHVGQYTGLVALVLLTWSGSMQKLDAMVCTYLRKGNCVGECEIDAHTVFARVRW